jgi:hypothetical protein
VSRIGKTRVGFFKTVGGFLAERGLTFRAEVPLRPVRVMFARLHQLDSIFAIFGAVSGGKPLYFRVWQIENRL